MSAFKIVQNIETLAVSSSGISTSSPIPLKSGYLRITSDQNVYVAVSSSPSLGTSSLWIAAGETVILKETVVSQKVVGIQTGTTTKVFFPEGTFSQFAIGDFVQLTGIAFSGINTSFAEVVSINTLHSTEGGAGYSREIEINHDTSTLLYPINFSLGPNNFYSPTLGGGSFIGILGSEGNVDITAELRKVVKVGAMGDGNSAKVHITEVQIAGG